MFRLSGVFLLREDQILQNVERNIQDTVAESETLVLGEFFQKRAEPQQKLLMRLDGGAGALRVIRHRCALRHCERSEAIQNHSLRWIATAAASRRRERDRIVLASWNDR